MQPSGIWLVTKIVMNKNKDSNEEVVSRKFGCLIGFLWYIGYLMGGTIYTSDKASTAVGNVCRKMTKPQQLFDGYMNQLHAIDC